MIRENDDVNDSVRRIVDKALDRRPPQETLSNSMTTTPLSPTILWRPNNYRLAVRFTGRSDVMLGLRASHSGLIFFKKDNITIQVGRDKIVGIWNQGKDRQTWCISRDSLKELESRLDEVRDTIRLKIESYVKDYAKVSKIDLFGDFFWVRHEDWIKGEEYIDKIPKEYTIHDSVFKKVYKESAIEFFGGEGKIGTAEVKMYIKNRVVENFAPDIAKELNGLHGAFDRFTIDALNPLTEQIKLHLEVQRETLNTLKQMQQSIKASNIKRLKDEWW